MQGKKGTIMIKFIIIAAVVLLVIISAAFIAGLYAVGAAWIHIYGVGRSEDERCGKDLSRIQKKSSKKNCRKRMKVSEHSQAHMKDMQ